MNLIQLRTQFRNLSGRHDLVNDDFSDNGADFFLNEGRKFLDRLDETQKSWASVFRFLEIGKHYITFPYCRAIKEVWAGTTTARWQIEKKNLQDLVAGYMTTTLEQITGGSPTYYSPAVTRYIPEDETADSFEAIMGYVDIPAGNAHEYNAIIIMPPPEIQTSIEVKGLFYSMELINDTDENYWSAVHPMLLYMSAMRQIEINNRNTQGVNDWSNSISVDMKQLGMDLVEEVIAEADQMEG